MQYSGRGVHQSSQCGIRLSTGEGFGTAEHRFGARAAGGCSYLPLPLVCLHGQRDFLPAEAIPSRLRSQPILEPMPLHHRASL